MTVIAIVAASINNVIGVDGKLPWNSPSDLANFQKETMGHAVLMGRKTWESLPRTSRGRLPGREKHVLSQTGVGRGGANGIWSNVSRAIPELLGKAVRKGKDKIFIIGGAEIFKQALELDLIDEVWLTRMLVKVEDVPGAVYFPQGMLEGWPVAIEATAEPEVGPKYRFERYENPKHTKKEEPETAENFSSLSDKQTITKQQQLLAMVVDAYQSNGQICYDLASLCADQLELRIDERPPQTGEAESPSPLAAEVASTVTATLATVGECLKAGLEIGGPVNIDSLTVNINIGK
jgi:dihydrofolate reductase